MNAHPAPGIGSSRDGLPRSPSVLLLVDFINPLQFEGAKDIAAGAWAAAKLTARLKQQLARRGVPAIYANDNYGLWRSDFHRLVDLCCSRGGLPRRLARLLQPGPDDLAVLKPRHSAFHATPLTLLLSAIGARHLVIVGLAADLCVQMTAMDAHQRGFELWVPADGTAAESPQRLQSALQHLGGSLGIETRAAGLRRGTELPPGPLPGASR